MLNLKELTFIIPVFIESNDRLNNAKTVLGYLNNYFKVNVKIHEITNDDTKLNFLKDFKNLKIDHIIEKSDTSVYHRTKQLNEMLDTVNTKLVANYDIDVLLPITSYIEAYKLIVNDNADVVYPYGYGDFQKQIFNSENLNVNFNLNNLSEDSLKIQPSRFGHCVFLNTKKYISAGGENENFISYGPEDSERFERFVKLNYKISRIENFVYHLEHTRTQFSNKSHEFYNSNEDLYNLLKNKNNQEIIDYYSNVTYISKYSNFKQKK